MDTTQKDWQNSKALQHHSNRSTDYEHTPSMGMHIQSRTASFAPYVANRGARDVFLQQLRPAIGARVPGLPEHQGEWPQELLCGMMPHSISGNAFIQISQISGSRKEPSEEHVKERLLMDSQTTEAGSTPQHNFVQRISQFTNSLSYQLTIDNRRTAMGEGYRSSPSTLADSTQACSMN